jgi:nuclear cap-binding protein subunit 1
LLHQLKKKAPAEEIQATIDAIHMKATEAGIDDVHVPSTDALATAICRLGAKSMSHLLSAIERGKEPLLAIADRSDAAKRQIVASVVEYWKDQPGVAVNIVDKLLNYQLLQPVNVIQWALGDHLGSGEPLSESWVFEMVSNTVTKVTNRNHQIVSARLVKTLSPEQITLIEEALGPARTSTRDIFKYIEDAVSGFAQGAAGKLIEKEASGELALEDVKLISVWAKRWHTVFLRKGQVEERVISEDSVDTKIRLLEAEPEPMVEGEAEADGEGQGNGAQDDGDTDML